MLFRGWPREGGRGSGDVSAGPRPGLRRHGPGGKKGSNLSTDMFAQARNARAKDAFFHCPIGRKTERNEGFFLREGASREPRRVKAAGLTYWAPDG